MVGVRSVAVAGGVASVVALLCGVFVGEAGAVVRVVGPGHPYAKPCEAIGVSGPGDVVQIDAAGNGGYDGDVCASGVAGLTIEGVNGRARIDAAGKSSGGKAIWVLSGDGMVVRNVELTGAAVPDRNGAGIRLEGGSLTLVGSSLHDNQEGILVGNVGTIDLTIEGSEFANNGFGDGYSHNIYVGAIHRFTMRYSASRGAKVGHLVKSRAAINDIAYNRLTGEGSTDSYEIDLPNGGRSNVVGNMIQQGPRSENPTLLAYGLEGASNADSRLTVVNNTFVNDRPGNATAVNVSGDVTVPAVVANNIVVGASTLVTQGSVLSAGNCLAADPGFVNRDAYDYRLREDSACRDVGVASPPGGAALPTEQYVYDLGHAPRTTTGAAPDAGAFEWAPPGGGGGGGTTSPPPAGGGGGTTPAAPRPLSVVAQRVRRDGSIRLTLKVRSAGRVTATARAKAGSKRFTYASGAARVRRAGTVTLTLKPTRTGARTLRRRHALTLTTAITLRPSSGAKAASRTVTLKLRRTAAGAVRRG